MINSLETRQVPTAEQGGAAAWVRATRFTSLTITLWSVSLQLIASTFVPPVASIGVAFGVVAIFLKGKRRNLAITAAMMGLVTLVGNLPGTIDELSHPASAPAFILTLFVVISSMAIMTTGVGAFRGWPTHNLKPLTIISMSLLLVGLAVSLSAASAVDSVEALQTDVLVIAQDISFDQTDLVVQAGTSGFWIDNRDGIRHTFTIESLDLEIAVPANSSQRSDLELAPGHYQVICVVPGHETMKIDLRVQG